MRRFVSGGLGRRIWGRDITARGGAKKGSNLTAFIRLQKTLWRGDLLYGGVHLKGLPALVEQGGRTKPHAIPSKKGRTVVAFVWGKASRPWHGKAFATQVRHPGSRIVAHPFARPAMEGHRTVIAGQIDQRIHASAKADGVA